MVAIVNLKPCKLAGVISEGMLLCAEDAEGNLSLLTTEKESAGRFVYQLGLYILKTNSITGDMLLAHID